MSLTKTQKEVLDQLSENDFQTAKQIGRRSKPLLSLYALGHLTVRPVEGARTHPLDPENPSPGISIYTHPQEDLLWKKRPR